MDTIAELTTRRTDLLRQAKALIDTADKEKRDLTGDEQKRFDGLHAESDALLRKVRLEVANFETRATPGGTPAGRVQPTWSTDRRALNVVTKGVSMRSLPTTRALPDGIRPEELSLDRAVRSMIRGDWTGAEAEQRAMATNVNTTGGYLVPEAVAREVIDLGRSKAVCFKLGMGVFEMEAETVRVPRWTADATFAQTGEGTTIAESTPTLDAINYVATKIATRTKVSTELIEDAYDMPNWLSEHLAAGFAAELDRLCLVGTGGSEAILGITNNTGITTTDGSVGAVADWGDVLDAVEDVRDARGEPNGLIMANDVRTAYDKLVTGDGTNSAKAYMVPPPTVAALQAETTTSMTAGELLVGDFTQMLLGIRRQFRIELSKDVSFNTDEVTIKCTWRGDLGIRHADRFALLGGIS